MKQVLLIVGSLRKNSFHRQMALEIKKLLEGRANVQVLEYADVPFLNQDIEFPAPAAVAKVRQAAQEADGIWILSPEYNYQIPGVLKNLLDWLSRPLIPNDPQRVSAVTGKTVTISSAAGSSAGAGVRKHLRALLEIMSMGVVGGEGTGIVLDGEAWGTNVLTLSDENRAALNAQADQLLAKL